MLCALLQFYTQHFLCKHIHKHRILACKPYHFAHLKSTLRGRCICCCNHFTVDDVLVHDHRSPRRSLSSSGCDGTHLACTSFTSETENGNSFIPLVGRWRNKTDPRMHCNAFMNEPTYICF